MQGFKVRTCSIAGLRVQGLLFTVQCFEILASVLLRLRAQDFWCYCLDVFGFVGARVL